MNLYQLRAPDGRMVRVKAIDLDDLKSRLEPGYIPESMIFGADVNGNGGLAAALMQDGTTLTLMGQLLEAHGDELYVWLRKRMDAEAEARANFAVKATPKK